MKNIIAFGILVPRPLTLLPEILTFDFMLRAFGAGILVALIAPAIGTFLVVRRYSQLADTLSHASLLGVALAMLLNVAPIPLALVVTILAALGIELIRNATKTYGESILALFLSGSLGLATVIISLAHGFNANLFAYLFGSITTITSLDLWIIGGLGIAVLGILRFAYQPLFLIALDEELAAAHGIPVRRYNTLLVVLAAITIGLALRIVGALLIGALMVVPVITALQLKKSFLQTIFFATAYAVSAVILGLVGSYYLDLAPGGTIVVLLVSFFLFTAGVRNLKT